MKWLSRAIYILIFLVMVTAPYAGHTYAEYAVQSSGSDETRVSSFGITVTATKSSFTATYKGTGDNSSKNTVSGTSSAKVLAPGTSGTFVAFTATGSAEVRTKITKTPTLTMSDNWTDASGKFYCPLVFTVTDANATNTINGLDYSSKADLVTALTNTLTNSNGEYSPGHNFGSSAVHNRTVTWSWPYDGATGSANAQSEANDNSLGSKKPTISISFNIRVDQID